jgi:hypothetical protein
LLLVLQLLLGLLYSQLASCYHAGVALQVLLAACNKHEPLQGSIDSKAAACADS